MNRPPSLIGVTDKLLSSLSLRQAYHCKMAGWYVRRYAHLVGLDNRWQMFGRQARFNWWYVITARYADPEEIVLSLPRQSKRTFLQRTLFDFKEAKFHLNLYGSDEGRKAYARYLCRQHPTHKGAPIESITFELHYQNILEPEEAAKRGIHVDPTIHRRVLNVFRWASVEE